MHDGDVSLEEEDVSDMFLTQSSHSDNSVNDGNGIVGDLMNVSQQVRRYFSLLCLNIRIFRMKNLILFLRHSQTPVQWEVTLGRYN